MSERQRSTERLRALPPLFTSGDVTRLFRWSANTADRRIDLWRDYGMVESFGRTGLHFNRVVDPRSPDHYADQALWRLFPSMWVGHATVLHEAGWTTQIPRDRHVYVMSRRSYPSVPGYVLHGRPKRWYDRARDQRDPETPVGGIRRVRPVFALADVIGRDELAGLDPDDIETDVAGEQGLELAKVHRLITRKPLPPQWHDWMRDVRQDLEAGNGPVPE